MAEHVAGRGLGIAGLGDDLEACLVLEDLADPGPDELVIVGEDDRDRLVVGLRRGWHGRQLIRAQRASPGTITAAPTKRPARRSARASSTASSG